MYTNLTIHQSAGHFHNRGRTLECLANILKEQSTFIHIRRNRYSIARSFTDSMARLAASYPEMKITPCIAKNVIHGQEFGHPHVSTCPRSTEHAGPVDLPMDDETWDALTTWQQFLWYADEMEHRWYTLQKVFRGDDESPRFIEVTWNNQQELREGVNFVRQNLGCTLLQSLKNEHPHVQHTEKLNCSQYLWEDLEYRKAMRFNSDQRNVLFGRTPQLLGGAECNENKEELQEMLRKYSKIHGIEIDERQWQYVDDLDE
jgi:hypothetical protein